MQYGSLEGFSTPNIGESNLNDLDLSFVGNDSYKDLESRAKPNSAEPGEDQKTDKNSDSYPGKHD